MLMQNETFGEAFELTTLAEVINKIPYREGLLGRLFTWEVIQSWTEDVRINSAKGSVQIVPSLDRDGVPVIRHGDKRKGFPVTIPGYAERFGILNRALLQVSAGLADEDALLAIETYVAQQLANVNGDLDLTVEHQRAKALTGDIVDSENTPIANMYDVMGVDQIECDVDLNSGSETLGDQLTEIVEIGEEAMGGEEVGSWMLIAEKQVSSRLMVNKDYKDAQNDRTAVRDRQIDGRKPVNINGMVDIHHYRRNDFLPAGSAFLVPNSPNMAKTILGPSDVEDFLGNILPRYPLVTQMRGKRGREVEVWTFILNYFSRPEAIIKLNFV